MQEKGFYDCLFFTRKNNTENQLYYFKTSKSETTLYQWRNKKPIKIINKNLSLFYHLIKDDKIYFYNPYLKNNTNFIIFVINI